MPSLGGWEIVIIIGVLVLLFGAKRLPDMARSIGQSARVFKGEMKGLKNEDSTAGGDAATDKPAAAPVAPPALPTPPPAQVKDTQPEPTRATQPGPGSTAQ